VTPPPQRTERAAATVARLRATLEAILDPLVPRGATTVLVGWGLKNGGDAALALGTQRWLAARGSAPRACVDRRTYDRDVLARHLGADGILLLAGGGTLGDVWRHQEDLRRRALADFPAHRVVQLPQTIHFSSPAAARAAAPHYAPRPGFAVLVRDAESVTVARDAWGVDAILAPDMAFLLDVARTSAPVVDRVELLRDDKESAVEGADRAYDVPRPRGSVDWPMPRPSARRLVRRVIVRTLARGGAAAGRRSWLLRADLRELVDRTRAGVELLSPARVVVTDRLHGAILALLLGIPVVAIPERYGKTRGFHRAWTTPCADVTWCESLEEARRLGATLPGGPGAT
jgi:pyruvyl transferase EpsO